MKKIISGTIIAISFGCSFTTLAESDKEIKAGIEAAVSVDGFFSPEIATFRIQGVTEGSPAARAGLEGGEDVLAIEDCEIPGCEASIAKKLMKRKAGEVLTLRIKKDGKERLVTIKF